MNLSEAFNDVRVQHELLPSPRDVDDVITSVLVLSDQADKIVNNSSDIGVKVRQVLVSNAEARSTVRESRDVFEMEAGMCLIGWRERRRISLLSGLTGNNTRLDDDSLDHRRRSTQSAFGIGMPVHREYKSDWDGDETDDALRALRRASDGTGLRDSGRDRFVGPFRTSGRRTAAERPESFEQPEVMVLQPGRGKDGKPVNGDVRTTVPADIEVPPVGILGLQRRSSARRSVRIWVGTRQVAPSGLTESRSDSVSTQQLNGQVETTNLSESLPKGSFAHQKSQLNQNADREKSATAQREGTDVDGDEIPKRAACAPCKRPKSGLITALFVTYWKTLIWTGLVKLIHDILVFLSPTLLKLLLRFMQQDQPEPAWHGYLYAVGIFLCAGVQTLVLQRYFRDVNILGMHIRTVITTAVYRKSLLLSNKARRESTTGQIMNLISTDAQHFVHLMTYVHIIWSGPFQIVVAVVLLWRELGPSVLAGIGVLVLLLPLNALVARLSKAVQEKKIKAADARIKIISEILNGIRVIKLYAWEPSFISEVGRLRAEEMHYLKRFTYLQSISFLWTCAPFFVAISSFGVYVSLSEQNILDAQKAFVSLTLFNILRFPLFMFPMVTSNLVQTYVSCKRLNKFLRNTEIDPDCCSHEDTPGVAAVIERGVFGWDAEQEPVLQNISIQFPEGQLTTIMGGVGSGKSSLLHAILGYMERFNGRVNVKGSVAYVPQEPWIFNATLRDNILLLRPYDPIRYNQVIENCSLRPDLDILPNGDMTEIGDKGINLSGGQKQRVSLARACYANADVYLLDDPLSAVDAHVGLHLLKNVLSRSGGMLANKTCILTTHSAKALPFSDRVVLMVDGQIAEIGTYRQLIQSRSGRLAAFVSDNRVPTEAKKDENTSPEMKENEEGVDDDEHRNTNASAHTPSKRTSSKTHHVLHATSIDTFGEDVQLQRTSSVRSTTSSTGISRLLSIRHAEHTLSTSSDMIVHDGAPFVFGSVLSDSVIAIDEGDGEEDQINQNAATESGVKAPKKNDSKGAGIIQEEQSKTGRVKLAIFKIYLRNVGLVYCLLILFSYPASHLASFGASLWLAAWSEDAKTQHNLTSFLHANPDAFQNRSEYPGLSDKLDAFYAQRDYRLGVYAGLGIVQALIRAVAQIVGHHGALRASSLLHNRCFEASMRSRAVALGYQQTTDRKLLTSIGSGPTAEILTRLSIDVANTDNVLPFTMTGIFNLLLEFGLNLTLQLAMLAVFSPAIMWTIGLTGVFLAVFVVMLFVQAVITAWVSVIAFAVGHLACAQKLHGLLLTAVLHAPAGFFDSVPQGRVVNRFAQDIATLDGPLLNSLKSAFTCFMHCSLTMCMACSVNPWIIVPVVVLTTFYMTLQHVYVANSRQLKRIESVNRSPIFSHFGETLLGVNDIRAYGLVENYKQINSHRLDTSNAATYWSMMAQRWLAVLLETVGNMLILSVLIFCVVTRNNLSAGFAGLVISYALNLNQSLNWLVRMTAELENDIICVERIDEYSNIEPEAAWEIAERTPPKTWPMGEIEFIDYGVRYRQDLDLVLQNINVKINRGERVGIVGRTGSGKSSLVMGLFRMLEANEGRILIDGVEIAELGLHDLRKRLTLIPQDPVLFSGTLRFNLDPFNQHGNKDLWNALALANLKSFAEDSGQELGLEMVIAEGGSNLSMGQRQLLCLARALLRRTQILVLDEATAAVDPVTDNLIQETIRREFSGCTVLTIAHRLNTVMDYDRIMVLDKGRVIELGNPQELVRDETTKFYALAKDAHLVD